MMIRVFNWHANKLTPNYIVSDWILAPSGGNQLLMCFTGRPAELQLMMHHKNSFWSI